MRNTSSTWLLVPLAMLFLAAPTARADEGEPGASWAPVRHLEFTPDDIEGGVLGPEGEALVSITKADHDSLIEIRRGFEPEIIKMIEDR